MAEILPTEKHIDEPYRRELALGEPQLSFRPFDLMVLEHYRNDPRYQYENTDIDGRICVTDEFYASSRMSDSDKVLLQTFGFAYDEDMNRAVAVFLRYMWRLSPEHQQIWKARECDGEFKIHPDYYDMNILGCWNTNNSVCDAILQEIRLINEMSTAMEWIRVFYETNDWGPWEKAYATLKEVRKLRQPEAHNLNDDQFDQAIIRKQRELLTRTYSALRTLRHIFQDHPAVAGARISVPSSIEQGNIVAL